MFLNLFNALIRKKIRVIRLFQILWLALGLAYYFAASAAIANSQSYLSWYSFAVLSGQTGLILFVVTLSPGIFKRFGIRNRFLGILTIFRRQLGITMFLLAAFHGTVVSLLPRFANGSILTLTQVELFGLLSLSMLFLLFLTSNDFSQARLGKFWWTLHRLVYLIMWTILFHVALQRFSFWSVTAGVLVTSEMAGILYSNFREKLRSKPLMSAA